MTSSGSAISTHWIPCTDTEDKRLYIMKKVCVITGGGSGMGLATAKLVCEEGYYTILVGRTASKLEKAVNDLRRAGGEAEAFSCDVSNRESCFALAKHAAECGGDKGWFAYCGP